MASPVGAQVWATDTAKVNEPRAFDPVADFLFKGQLARFFGTANQHKVAQVGMRGVTETVSKDGNKRGEPGTGCDENLALRAMFSDGVFEGEAAGCVGGGVEPIPWLELPEQGGEGIGRDGVGRQANEELDVCAAVGG